MTISGLTTALLSSPALAETLSSRRTLNLGAVPGLHLPLAAAALQLEQQQTQRGRSLLIVVASTREAEQALAALQTLLPGDRVAILPAWETLPHERLSPSAETVAQRYRVLTDLRRWSEGNREQNFVIIAPVRSALQPLQRSLTDTTPIRLERGSFETGQTALVQQLSNFGFTRVDLVYRRGEFAVRGGIVDVFPATAAQPIRIDYFGDEVEELQVFSVSDQRSFGEQLDELEIFPVRELLSSDAIRARAAQAAQQYPALSELLEKVANGLMPEGMESLAALLSTELVPLSALMPENTILLELDPEAITLRADALSETDTEFLRASWELVAETEQPPVDFERSTFLSLADLEQAMAGDQIWQIRRFLSLSDATVADFSDDSEQDGPALLGEALPSFGAQLEAVFEFLRQQGAAQNRVVLPLPSVGLIERAKELLAGQDLPYTVLTSAEEEMLPGLVSLLAGQLPQGFALPESQLTVLSETEFFGRRQTENTRSGRVRVSRKNQVDPLQLKAGDFVVHETHGVGKFIELTKRKVKVGGVNPQVLDKEYLVLEYAASKRGQAGDKLFIPTDQLDRLTKYQGSDTPALNKMGGSDWRAAKSRARKAVRELAVDLVKLYSARMASKGHAFAPDTPWQGELEDSFPYLETQDQLSAIEDVKADMEKDIPMDRLILGDVGYGKTEIAVRAAFKAIQDGKQAAVLVPTTLLVKQHLETFQSRFAGFPVVIRGLSRFQSNKEAAETIAGLADGSVDMVIGTHRLLSDKVKFRDLGLLVIDEEQRFGVDHKEALKDLKKNVDLLSMSATPIPRTLEMAITGIREMSTLSTPPEDRHPILTYVGPRNDAQITAAIRRELLREGQVFFLHNRVRSINRIASELAELVPEARIAVAHGQLSESALEQVIVDFWERKIDVLVCTTIIETGIDIPNANTLIIDEAERYGLSQLHQIRGRVGRSRERAYAYFLHSPEKQLNETAYERLTTIAANNDLGSGMQIALKDLELRGAGELLGAEQSGHIAGVGFDLYLRMIGEAVSAYQGESLQQEREFRVDLPVRGYLPESYLDSERLRLEAYQKLSTAAASGQPERLEELKQELVDRYGEIPDQLENLFALARLRQTAESAGITDIYTAAGSKVKIEPVALAESRKVRLQRLYPQGSYNSDLKQIQLELPAMGTHYNNEVGLIEWVRGFIQTIILP